MSNERPAKQQPEARLIQLLGQGMENSAFRLTDHVKLGDLPLEIDAVVTSPKPKWRPEDAQYSRLFHYFRQHNVMEIKTDRDRFKVEDVPKLFESEVKKIMLDLEEENWRNIFSLVDGQKIISALGKERIISLLGEKKIVSVLGEKKILSALGGKKVVFTLGEKRILSMLGEKRIFSALGYEKVVDALLKNRRLLNLLLAKLDGKRHRKLPVKKAAIARNARRLNPA